MKITNREKLHRMFEAKKLDEARRFNQLDELRNYFDDSKLLNEIVDALSDRDFGEIYDHIVRMWSIEDLM